VGLKPYRKPQAAIVRHVAGFMAAIRGIKYEPALLLMLGGGLRLEEVCGLMWRDISPCLVSGGNLVQVDVKQAVTMAYNRPVIKETRNETTTRIVVVGNPFTSRLDAIRGDDAAPLVECAPATFTHNWRAWCARHRLEYVRPKDLRTSYATLCGEAGCIDSLVSMQMGHADATTKGRYYQRATVRGGVLVAETLADYLAESAANGTQIGT
jgi:integrase